jgi:regulator of sirC expression with transglutaminase-like and TPR domain
MMTPTINDIRPLLRLLDDESTVVREAVRKKLAGMRRELPQLLQDIGEPLEDGQERLLSEILTPVCQEELEETWLAWRWLSTPQAQLEESLGQLSAFLSGWQASVDTFGQRLDSLAKRAEKDGQCTDVRKLADYLFGGRGHDALMRGNTQDYYAAQNSNLLWVLDCGLGNPISLCCIYILIGKRLGMHIEGCNFPGHFLARVQYEDRTWLVDCFNRGRFMLAEDVAKHHPAANPSMEEVIHDAATVETVVARVLRNLDDAYERSENFNQRQVVRRLILKLMED